MVVENIQICGVQVSGKWIQICGVQVSRKWICKSRK